jgi:hypothetical protein
MSETDSLSRPMKPETMHKASSASRRLGEYIVQEKEAHDLSRNPEFASFQFLGYRTSAVAVELVALCDADGISEGDVVRRRDEFFDLVRRLPHDYGLKPRGRNPNGLLGFVFADGCPESMARFIARQTRISHAAGTGGVSVAWAIDVPNRRIHTHDNPVSIFPPVIVAARTVYPGLEFLDSLLNRVAPEPGAERPAEGDDPATDAHDVFISYASEDRGIAVEIARALEARHLRVWIDETALRPGDSLRQAVETGLAGSRFGLVLLSRNFFRKEWTQRELNGLFTREMAEGRTLVLPLWHQIDAREIAAHSPILADKVALKTSDGIPWIADKIAELLHLPLSRKEPPPEPADASETETHDAGSGKVHILFLAANSDDAPLDLERELSRIEMDLRLARERDRLLLKPVMAATVDRVMQAMLDDPPTIVHFSGHGLAEGIVLRDAAGNPHLVSGRALASLFALFRETVKCVVLNVLVRAAGARHPGARSLRDRHARDDPR